MIDKLTRFQQSFFAEPKKRALAVLASGVFALSFMPILVRLGEREISPTAVIFDRFWICTIILGLWNGLLTVRHKRPKDVANQYLYSNRTLGLLLGGGICFTAGQLIWAWSLTQTSIANSSLLHSFIPLFATLGGWLFFAQNFDRRFIIGMIVAIIGSIILGFDDLLYQTDKIQGDTIALISTLFFTTYLLLVERIRDHFKLVTIIFYYCAIGIVMLIPFVLISNEPILPSSLSGWLVLIGLAVNLLLVYITTAYTLKWLSSALVTVVLLIDPVLSVILAWVIFSEALDFWNLVAFLVVLFGIYLVTTSESVIKDKDEAEASMLIRDKV